MNSANLETLNGIQPMYKDCSGNFMAGPAHRNVTHLEKLVDELPDDKQEIFHRIFRVSTSIGDINLTDTFVAKAMTYFNENGESKEQTLERISSQLIVKTFNNYTLEGALFNELRTNKPGSKPESLAETRKKVFDYIEDELKKRACDFCEPEKFTPKDLPFRIKGKHCVTAANVAKYDALHGILIFNEHNPFIYNQEEFSDYMETGFNWFMQMYYRFKQAAAFPFLMWNCMPRSGASQIHGHMQLLSTGDMPYAEIERLRLAKERYRRDYNSDYLEDLFSIHESLGLGFQYNDAKIITCLTPVKDKETIISCDNVKALKESIYKISRCFIDRLGVFSFNLTVQMPSINCQRGWEGFPYVARIVDRGNPLKTGADIGAMELYGSRVIGSDPYKIKEALENQYDIIDA